MPHVVAGYGGLVARLLANVTASASTVYRPIETVILPFPWSRGDAILIGDAVHAPAPSLAAGKIFLSSVNPSVNPSRRSGTESSHDSPLEGDGFELPVREHRAMAPSHGFAADPTASARCQKLASLRWRGVDSNLRFCATTSFVWPLRCEGWGAGAGRS